MKSIRIRGRRWPTAGLLAVAAIAIGAVFGGTRNGEARSTIAPANSAPPAISGTAAVGSTLTTSDGTWTGTAPLTFVYSWSRCDQTGASCAAISGATSKTYDLKAVDAGNTLRVTVTATNNDGSTQATSVPSAVVSTPAAPPATGCPSGTGTIDVATLAPPARLALDEQSVTPGVVTPSAKTIQVHFRVTACGGRPVQNALLYAAAVPFNQYTVPAELATGSDGGATLTMTQLSGFPAARQQQLLVVFARARKPGDDITAGISTRLLVSFPVSLKG